MATVECLGTENWRWNCPGRRRASVCQQMSDVGHAGKRPRLLIYVVEIPMHSVFGRSKFEGSGRSEDIFYKFLRTLPASRAVQYIS